MTQIRQIAPKRQERDNARKELIYKPGMLPLTLYQTAKSGRCRVMSGLAVLMCGQLQ
ncbi:hypothetical protein [Kamptonema formosum]|uniref:hypothetical protein n=1 Tax=Kamptonema formosum TaxID=331992 RepID=UPI00038236B8|nr:hypothetical protein [Oscillatoria sp. PCC 10802]